MLRPVRATPCYHGALKHVCLFVCLSICLSAGIFQENAHLNFLYMLPVAVAWSSSNCDVTRYVLPVLWMTSCFHVMKRMGQNQRRHVFRSVRQVASLESKVCRLQLRLFTGPPNRPLLFCTLSSVGVVCRRL